jgi:hypothetical protein
MSYTQAEFQVVCVCGEKLKYCFDILILVGGRVVTYTYLIDVFIRIKNS